MLLFIGPAPVGFAYEIKSHSEASHGIPMEVGETNSYEILRVICTQLKVSSYRVRIKEDLCMWNNIKLLVH